ncbi:MAG: LytR C-terminal domain-containing protein [Actinomycetes bacterium]
MLSPHDLIRPWRRATLVASLIAALELVLLLGAGAMILAKPLSHTIQRRAEVAALAPTPQAKAAVRQLATPPVGTAAPRSHTRVMVLNGNGHSGAASSAASQLQGLGYVVSGTGNAKHQNYATSVVMYRPGYRAAGERLARELHVKVVGPLDGLRPGMLQGGQLAIILGA